MGVIAPLATCLIIKLSGYVSPFSFEIIQRSDVVESTMFLILPFSLIRLNFNLQLIEVFKSKFEKIIRIEDKKGQIRNDKFFNSIKKQGKPFKWLILLLGVSILCFIDLKPIVSYVSLIFINFKYVLILGMLGTFIGLTYFTLSYLLYTFFLKHPNFKLKPTKHKYLNKLLNHLAKESKSDPEWASLLCEESRKSIFLYLFILLVYFLMIYFLY